MSSIPNSAMPHATAEPETEGFEVLEAERPTLGARAGKLAGRAKDKVRENPKTAIAAGAALAAGAIAAAAIPLARAATRKSAAKKSGSRAKKSG